MKTRLKMFVLLVVFGFGTSMLFLYIDWELYTQCFEEGLFPSFSDTERCSHLFESTIPQTFGLIGFFIWRKRK